MALDYRRVENFLYREARLMDDSAYDEWLALWADDGLYWVPCNVDDPDPERQVSAIYDNRRRLEDRVTRLRDGPIYAQDPKSRMRRVISNIEIEEGADGQVTTHSNFVLAELRHGEQDIFAGRAIHNLRPDGDSFRIVFKKVLLVNNDEPIDNLTFLL